MEDWKRSLDRYLTQEPPDDSGWFEKCVDHIPEDIWQKYEEKYEKQIDKWMEFMFQQGHEPEYAAKIIVQILIQRQEP